MQDKNPSNHPILKAIQENNTTKVIEIIQGELPNDSVSINRALMTAVINVRGNSYVVFKDAVKFLLEKGANPNIFQYCSNLEVAKILFLHGADINKKFNDATGGTLLHNAVIDGKLDLIEFALENKADFNLKSKNMLTPLQHIDLAITEFPIFSFFSLEDQLSKKIKYIEKARQIYRLFLPYIINANQKENFLYILEMLNKDTFGSRPYIRINNLPIISPKSVENHSSEVEVEKTDTFNLSPTPALSTIDIKKLSYNSCKNCVLWINELLSLAMPPKWLTDKYRKELSSFVNLLVEKLYPGLLDAINEITDDRNFLLVKKALLSSETIFGLAEGLDLVTQLYESGLLNCSVALKIQNLREKMEIIFDRHEKFNIQAPKLSEKEINEIHKFIDPLHQSLMSMGGEYEKTSYVWQRRRILEKFSDIDGFPTKEKIRKIDQSTNFLCLSLGAKKDSKGNQKSLQVLHDSQEKRKSTESAMINFARLKII